MAEKCSLKDLFIEELRDIYHAEGQLVKALPKMARTVNNADLKAAIEQHLEETKGQVERLDRVFEAIGQILDERAVDLQRVDGKALEVIQR